MIKRFQAMGTENLQFFGADPVQEINKDLYNKIGSYYPVAVAAKAGYASADVLEGWQTAKKDFVFQTFSPGLSEIICALC